MTTEQNEEKQQIRIGDKVRLVSDWKNKTYMVYSVTYYYWGRTEYTIWIDDEYERVEWWQIELVPTELKIGFATPYEINPTHLWN